MSAPEAQLGRNHRREMIANRLSTTNAIMQRLDATIAELVGGSAESPDPGGVLRASVRAVLTVAHQEPTLDVTLTAGSMAGLAVRVRLGEDGPTADVVSDPRWSGTFVPTARTPTDAGCDDPFDHRAGVAYELAEVLRRGADGAR